MADPKVKRFFFELAAWMDLGIVSENVVAVVADAMVAAGLLEQTESGTHDAADVKRALLEVTLG